MTENTRLIVKCVIVAIVTAIVLVRYAKACGCDQCDRLFAIWTRFNLQMCRRCKSEQDRHVRRFRPRRSIFDRIRRRAA